MMCSNCGHEVNEEDKFCLKCGHSVKAEEETAAAAATINPVEEAAPVQPAGTGSGNTKENESIEQLKETAKNYWIFVKANLQSPAGRGLQNTGNDFVFAYINIALFALFFGLGTYFQARGAASIAFFGGGVSFSSTFFSIFFYSIASLLIGAGLVFIVSKFLLKINITFHEVLGRFGALLTISVALSAAYFLFAVPGLYTLIGLITMLMAAGVQIALVITLFSRRKEAASSFDPVYGLLIVFAGYAIFLALTSDVFLKYFIGGFLPF